MRLEYQILSAFAIDLILGDPRWLPHPVRGIGRLALWLETLSRQSSRHTPCAVRQQPSASENEPLAGAVGRTAHGVCLLPFLCQAEATRIAGLLAALTTYILVGLATWAAIHLAAAVHPWAADAVSIFVIYMTIAAHDLARHSMAVFSALVASDLDEARRRVAKIVGRDTQQLDEAGVVRAAVESVAESTVDGVTAPLFFAAIAGPVGAMVYRAVNTLDSMFGHQDDRYRHFGWAAARIDDLANYLPARLTAPLMCLAAARASILSARHALRILLRDGRKHASPNAGLAEAAMAGALGVQLGGVNYYDGQPLEKPTIGDPLMPLSRCHIVCATLSMLWTSALFLVACLLLRAGAVNLWQVWGTSA